MIDHGVAQDSIGPGLEEGQKLPVCRKQLRNRSVDGDLAGLILKLTQKGYHLPRRREFVNAAFTEAVRTHYAS
jgi:hypothetical protein